jgi:hypothetical protein
MKQIGRKTKNLHRKKLRDENERDLFRGFSCYLGCCKDYLFAVVPQDFMRQELGVNI